MIFLVSERKKGQMGKNSYVTIQPAMNGFEVWNGNKDNQFCETYVFETFESMEKWLRQHFDDPPAVQEKVVGLHEGANLKKGKQQ
jgi:hypothetical protein